MCLITLVLYFSYVVGEGHATTHMWRSEDSMWGHGRSLFSPSTLWLWGSNPGCRAWQQTPFLTRLSHPLLYNSHSSKLYCAVFMLLVLSLGSMYSVCLCGYHFYYLIFHPASLNLHLNVSFPYLWMLPVSISRSVSCCLRCSFLLLRKHLYFIFSGEKAVYRESL